MPRAIVMCRVRALHAAGCRKEPRRTYNLVVNLRAAWLARQVGLCWGLIHGGCPAHVSGAVMALACVTLH